MCERLNQPSSVQDDGPMGCKLLRYIVPPVFTNSDKGKYKGTRCPVDICSVPTEAAAETKKII